MTAWLAGAGGAASGVVLPSRGMTLEVCRPLSLPWLWLLAWLFLFAPLRALPDVRLTQHLRPPFGTTSAIHRQHQRHMRTETASSHRHVAIKDTMYSQLPALGVIKSETIGREACRLQIPPTLGSVSEVDTRLQTQHASSSYLRCAPAKAPPTQGLKDPDWMSVCLPRHRTIMPWHDAWLNVPRLGSCH